MIRCSGLILVIITSIAVVQMTSWGILEDMALRNISLPLQPREKAAERTNLAASQSLDLRAQSCLQV